MRDYQPILDWFTLIFVQNNQSPFISISLLPKQFIQSFIQGPANGNTEVDSGVVIAFYIKQKFVNYILQKVNNDIQKHHP